MVLYVFHLVLAHAYHNWLHILKSFFYSGSGMIVTHNYEMYFEERLKCIKFIE